MGGEERLRELNLPTPRIQKYRGDVIEVCKIAHGLYDPQACSGLLKLANARPDRTRGHKYKLKEDSCRLNDRLHCFSHGTIDQWSNFPSLVMEAQIVDSFERLLDKLWNSSDVMFNPDGCIRQPSRVTPGSIDCNGHMTSLVCLFSPNKHVCICWQDK